MEEGRRCKMICRIMKKENAKKDVPNMCIPALSILYSDLPLPMLSALYSSMLRLVDDRLGFLLGRCSTNVKKRDDKITGTRMTIPTSIQALPPIFRVTIRTC